MPDHPPAPSVSHPHPDFTGGTGEDFLSFLDYLLDSKIFNETTVRSYRSSANQVLSVLNIDPLNIDMRDIDVEAVLRRFKERRRDNYEESSMASYQTRFRRAVEMYQDYRASPTQFWDRIRGRLTYSRSKGPGWGDLVLSDAALSSYSPAWAGWLLCDRCSSASSSVGRPRGDDPADEEMVVYPFPLRSGATAHLRLPRTLPAAEVERLCAFLHSLGIDEPLVQHAPPKRERN